VFVKKKPASLIGSGRIASLDFVRVMVLRDQNSSKRPLSKIKSGVIIKSEKFAVQIHKKQVLRFY
jgi:hypothetical protein